MKNKNVKLLTVMGVLVALEIVAERLLTIDFAENRFNFTFIMRAISGTCLGAWPAAVIGGVADLIGAIIRYGSINPGITLAAILRGAIYGSFLFKKCTTRRLALAALLDQFVCGFIIVSLSLFWYAGMSINAINVSYRLGQAVIMFALELLVLPLLNRDLFPYLRRLMVQQGIRRGERETEAGHTHDDK